MRATVDHLGVLQQHVLVVSVDSVPQPHVPEAERVVVNDLGYRDDGISHVTLRFGFEDEIHVPWTLTAVEERGVEGPLDLAGASYFLSKIDLRMTDASGMAAWRKRLFLATTAITADPVDYFALPRDRTVLMGSRIDL
jgi:KUP system potassium uptake protein